MGRSQGPVNRGNSTQLRTQTLFVGLASLVCGIGGLVIGAIGGLIAKAV